MMAKNVIVNKNWYVKVFDARYFERGNARIMFGYLPVLVLECRTKLKNK